MHGLPSDLERSAFGNGSRLRWLLCTAERHRGLSAKARLGTSSPAPLGARSMRHSVDNVPRAVTNVGPVANSAAHVLFTLGDAGRAGTSDSRARRTPGLRDEATLRTSVPPPSKARFGSSISPRRHVGLETFWRQKGRTRQGKPVEQLKWWRRRESVCHDRRILE